MRRTRPPLGLLPPLLLALFLSLPWAISSHTSPQPGRVGTSGVAQQRVQQIPDPMVRLRLEPRR